MKTILVCDDDQARARRWSNRLETKAALPKGFRVQPLTSAEFSNEIERLTERRAALRQGEEVNDAETAFDSAAVLLIDYDLFELEDSLLNGEMVAYLARCYSTCGVIIGINQFGENQFDLRLTGHPHSFADINIGDEHVANPGLWRTSSAQFDGWEGFRPWAWPSIPQLVRDFERRVGDVSANINGPVYDAIGFDSEMLSLLPTAIRDYLSGQMGESSPTFNEVVVESGLGLRRGDVLWEPALARVAASRVSAWLEQLVLPPQDVIIDAPHLVSRFPSVAKSSLVGDTLDNTTILDVASNGALDSRVLANCRFEPRHWLSRPAWIWPRCTRNIKIAEVADPFSPRQTNEKVFCEDISAWRQADRCLEYSAGAGWTYARRNIVGPNSGIPGYSALNRVEYVPAGRLLNT